MAARRWKRRPNPNNIQPYEHVLDAKGYIIPHRYEPPHDDPGAGGSCWDCVLPEKHPAHAGGTGRTPSRRTR